MGFFSDESKLTQGPPPTDDDYPTIPTWSYTSLKQYEACPFSAYLRSIAKEPRPEIEDDPNHPLVRGRRLHKEAEDFVQGLADITPGLKKYEEPLTELAENYKLGLVDVEQQWAFDRDWKSTDWFAGDTWCRMVADVVVRYEDDPTALLIIDYKTGKKFNNELKHIQQAQLYAVGAFMRYPDVTDIHTNFWYFDHANTYLPKTYTRDKATRYLATYTRRGLAMTSATTFPPKPNVMNCKFCDYGTHKGTGVCPYAVDPS